MFLFVFIVAVVCATTPIGRRPRLHICILSPQHPACQTGTQTREIRMETFRTDIWANLTVVRYLGYLGRHHTEGCLSELHGWIYANQYLANHVTRYLDR